MGPFANETYLTQIRKSNSWYADQAHFVWTSNPWFARGGDHNSGSETGVFAFGNTNGHVYDNVSFRLVLTP